jgi:hypothetical protein
VVLAIVVCSVDVPRVAFNAGDDRIEGEGGGRERMKKINDNEQNL